MHAQLNTEKQRLMLPTVWLKPGMMIYGSALDAAGHTAITMDAFLPAKMRAASLPKPLIEPVITRTLSF